VSSLAHWRTGTVESGGEDIYYEVVERDAPQATVVLTHGAGGSHAVWYQQVVALADDYRVVTWDARGFGNSTYRTGAHGATASAEDLGAVLDATGTPDAHLVGQSMGGWWVTTFALAWPDRVRSLTLCNTIGGCWNDGLDAHFASYVATARSEAPEAEVAGRHPAVGAADSATDLAKAFLYQQLNTFHSPPMADVFPVLVKTRHSHDAIRALPFPKLVITSSEDPIFPAAHVWESADGIGADIIEIEGAGHSSYWERPDEFNKQLLAFLSRAEER
jgi:3-oxoadipate enol-lactonase